MQLKDRVAIVTGGGKGIGKHYCQALVREGARVAVTDIDEKAARNTARELGDAGFEALAIAVDVSKVGDVKRMVEEVLGCWGRIDILVNNAAIFATLSHQNFWEIEEEEWDRVMAVNVKGMFLCVREVLPAMKKQGYGKIINISSGTVFKGTPHLLHYVSSKAAVVGLSRALSREVGSMGIRVNVLAPGLTESDTVLELKTTPPAVFEKIRQSRALARTEVPEDLTGTLIYLASQSSDFVTGQTIVVDGGSVTH